MTSSLRDYPVLLLVFLISLPAFSQKKSLYLHQTKQVSVVHIDSISSELIDSLRRQAEFGKGIDSIKVIVWADSVRANISRSFDARANRIHRQIDSLNSYSLPTTRLQSKLDRLQRKQLKLNEELNQKQGILQSKIQKRYQDYGEEIRSKLRIDPPNMQFSNNGLKSPNLPSSIQKIPNSKVNLPSLPKALDGSDFKALNLSRDFRKVGGKVSVPSEQLKHWENSLPALRELQSLKAKGSNYKEALKNPEVTGEQLVKQLDAVKEVQEKIPGAGNLKNNEALQVADVIKDPQSMQQQAIKLATDHFAGREKELQTAMSEMAKYKKKYTSLPQLDDAKKFWWLRNSLRGMRFEERIRFGIATGIRSGRDTIHLDFYPTISYRLTGRIETGVGAIYRLHINTKNYSASSLQGSPWGFSAFTVVKTFKNVFMRLEADGTPPITDGKGPWRITYLSGIQTYFPIFKHLQGNVQMLYSFDHALKDSFPDRIVARIGVQWRIK